MKPLEIGRVRVSNVVEWYGPTRPTWVLPEATTEGVERHRDWLAPHFLDERGRFLMSIHSFIVQAPGLTVLVDTCVGNDKPRENPTWNMLKTDFLERLGAAGFPPESIDLVLCTHLHVDHIGWNTRLQGGRWVPTFPRARSRGRNGSTGPRATAMSTGPSSRTVSGRWWKRAAPTSSRAIIGSARSSPSSPRPATRRAT